MARTLSRSARERLLLAAGEILIEGGLPALTVEAVAKRSGVAKTTLYRHFGGLDGLMFAAVAAAVREPEGPDTGDLRADLREIQHRYLEVASSPLHRAVFTWMLTRSLEDPLAAQRFREARFQSQGPTVLALQRAIARGEIPPETDIEAAMHLIQGPLISKRIIHNLPVSDAELESLLDIVVSALRCKGTSIAGCGKKRGES